MNAGLEFRDVTVRYGSHRAVSEVSFTARGGQVLALLGPNGSGKSSLLRAAAGLRRHDGRVVLSGPPGARIGFLPQDSGARAALTVLETVLLGRLHALGMRVPDSEVARAGTMLARLGIEDLAHRHIADLSGGQRQLVFLAQVLAGEPAVLLLDEPTSALDLRNQFEMLGLLRRLARREGLVVVVAIHDLNAASEFADEIVVLHEGRIAATGAPAEVLTRRLLSEVYGLEAELCRTRSGRSVVVPVAAAARPRGV